MTRLLSILTPRRLALLLVVAAVVVTGTTLRNDHANTTITAYFDNTTGLYEGDDVRVLGVRVGEVTSVKPRGDRVKVELSVDGEQPIPAGARAAIVSPSLVSGRFVQLEPAWTEGPRLDDGAVIDLDRTAVPVSFDEVKQELTDLATALGPGKGRGNGELRRAVTVIEKNLSRGDARQLRQSLSALRSAADSLADGRGDLFSTIDHLNDFTRNLATSDAAVRGFSTELADVGTVLRSNRTLLTSAVRELSVALSKVGRLIDTNGSTLTATVAKTNRLAALLADRSNELAGVLHVAPHSLIGLHNTIEDQAINGRATLANLDSVAQLVCGAVLGAGGTEKQCRQALQPLLDLLGLSSLPDLPPVGGGTPGAGDPQDPLDLTGLPGLPGVSGLSGLDGLSGLGLDGLLNGGTR
jgi:phospholipid/cholesterol/gamma-HCH transport system substrate-binding protein